MPGMRWPTKPRPDDKCDAHTGYTTDHLGKPCIRRCDELATETAVMTKLGFAIYVCAICAPVLEAKGQIVRNPKRKVLD